MKGAKDRLVTETDGYEGTIWEGVPQPEKVIDLVRGASKGDDKAKSGIRGCISVYKTIPARAKVVEFLQFVLRKYR